MSEQKEVGHRPLARSEFLMLIGDVFVLLWMVMSGASFGICYLLDYYYLDFDSRSPITIFFTDSFFISLVVFFLSSYLGELVKRRAKK